VIVPEFTDASGKSAACVLTLGLLAAGLSLSPSSGWAEDSIDLFDEDGDQSSAPSDDSGESGSSDEGSPASVSIESVDESGGSGDAAASSDLVPGRHERTITLSFEKRGTSMLVPATINGKDVYFLFDTGASYTSLNPEVADAVNADPPDNAPSQPVNTANGRAMLTFGLLDRLRLDRKLHRNVTFGLCRGCPNETFRGKPVAGLLGLNVLNRYEIDINSNKGVVEMTPNASHGDRMADIEPWIELRDIRGVRTPERDGKRAHLVRFTAVNRSPRPVGSVELSAACRGGRATGESVTMSLAPGASTEREVEFRTENCPRPRVDVVSADW
jgi:hypothetical protein